MMDGRAAFDALALAGATAPAVAAPLPGHVVRCRAGGHLRAIHDPAVTLAIWQRRLPPALVRGIDRFTVADWPGVRLATTADTVRGDLGRTAARHLPAPMAADIARMVRLYAGMVATRTVALRLDAVADDGCAYFHVDHVGVRLLCTYRGAGTLWLPDDAVNRTALGTGNNDAVSAGPGRVRSLATGHVALAKGEAWPGNRGRGLVHRSPPADAKGPPRLLLVLDHETG